MTVLILQCNDKIAIRKRNEGGILSNLWELPNLNGILSEQAILQQLSAMDVTVASLHRPAGGNQPIKHIFTHIEWEMSYWVAECKTMCDGLVWVSERQLEDEIALPTAFKKIYSRFHSCKKCT